MRKSSSMGAPRIEKGVLGNRVKNAYVRLEVQSIRKIAEKPQEVKVSRGVSHKCMMSAQRLYRHSGQGCCC